MDPILDAAHDVTRRHFFGQCGIGLGSLALASLLQTDASADPSAAASPHFPARAKRVIYIHLAGSPPQQDLLDFKPKLNELNGQPAPKSFYENERFAFIKGVPKLLGSPYKFKRHGQSGAELSELLPHLASVADDLTLS